MGKRLKSDKSTISPYKTGARVIPLLAGILGPSVYGEQIGGQQYNYGRMLWLKYN